MHHAELLETLDTFLAETEAGAEYLNRSPETLTARRDELADALAILHTDGRPLLTSERSATWALETLSRTAQVLERAAQGDDEPARQARLFLARLPFPGQWARISQLEAEGEPEITALAQAEQRKIAAKLERKRLKRFKLRHFCQVLKSPAKDAEQGGEPGALRVYALRYAFTDPALLTTLARRYALYIEPAMGVVFRHSWSRAFTAPFSASKMPTVIGMDGADDLLFLSGQQGVLTVKACHGDFMRLDTEPPTPPFVPTHSFDIGFNGLYDEIERKRHGLLLDVLKHPALATATALMLGRGAPEKVVRFRRMVARAGLERRVTALDNLPRKDVGQWLARCRIGAHLSLNENGPRAIWEFLRADKPVVISAAMAGFDFAAVNKHTGRVAQDGELPEVLAQTIADADSFSPHQWFMEHAGHVRASQRLNQGFKDACAQADRPWTRDIVCVLSSGPDRYADPDGMQRFAADRAWIGAQLAAHDFPVPFDIE